jgi:hypothetical protein
MLFSIRSPEDMPRIPLAICAWPISFYFWKLNIPKFVLASPRKYICDTCFTYVLSFRSNQGIITSERIDDNEHEQNKTNVTEFCEIIDKNVLQI